MLLRAEVDVDLAGLKSTHRATPGSEGVTILQLRAPNVNCHKAADGRLGSDVGRNAPGSTVGPNSGLQPSDVVGEQKAPLCGAFQ
jgi:hypothetical protein